VFQEMGKVLKEQTEISPIGRREIEEGRKPLEVNDNPERVMEVPETSEMPLKEFQEGTKILQPDLEIIKTQSLEAVKQSNLEKAQNAVNEAPESKMRELTEEEKQALRENTHLSESAINNIWVDAEGNYHLKCINEGLAGQEHKITNVKYVEKTVNVDGVDIIVVVPEFPCIFEVNIPAEMWEMGDRAIFSECTKQLKEYLETHPEMKSNFNEQQLEQIMNEEPYIKGFSWHHNEVPGKMQMVETKVHAPSNHTGGNHIWCGGIR